jgi:hypothetical protein
VNLAAWKDGLAFFQSRISLRIQNQICKAYKELIAKSRNMFYYHIPLTMVDWQSELQIPSENNEQLNSFVFVVFSRGAAL